MDKSIRDKFYTSETSKKILSLDGGGVRGALTLGYLERVESLLRQRFNNKSLVLSDYYDLIGGTSTGAIIATCLAIGKPVSEIIDLYSNLGKVVFGSRRYSIIPRSWKKTRALLKSTYKSEVLENLLKEHLGDIRLCDYDKMKCPLTIISKRADSYSLWTVSNHPDGIYSKAMSHLKLWELCRASSAAPYYFTPKKLILKSRQGDSFEAAFIDGGVSLANNPAIQIFLTVTTPSYGFQWKPGEDNIYITSFGTGNGVNKDNVDVLVNGRSLNWATKLPELFMTDALETNQVVLQLFGKNYGDTEVIDRQYMDLTDVNFNTEKLFSFVRFNVKLTQDALRENLNIIKSVEEINSLTQLDHHENIDDLLEIGRKAAEKLDDSVIL